MHVLSVADTISQTQNDSLIRLALHRTQPTMLPRNPLLDFGELRVLLEPELLLLVKFSRKIVQDSRSLHDAKRSTVGGFDVVIDKYRDTSIRANVSEPGLLLDVLHDVDALEDVIRAAVCVLELFEENGRFVALDMLASCVCIRAMALKPTIGGAKGQKLQALAGLQAIGTFFG